MSTINPDTLDDFIANPPDGSGNASNPVNYKTSDERSFRVPVKTQFENAKVDITALENSTQNVPAAKGELWGHDGTTTVRIAAAGANFRILTTDDSETSGFKYETAQFFSPTQAKGDIIARGGAGLDERVEAGADGLVIGYSAAASAGLKSFQVIKPASPFTPDKILVVDVGTPNVETAKTSALSPEDLNYAPDRAEAGATVNLTIGGTASPRTVVTGTGSVTINAPTSGTGSLEVIVRNDVTLALAGFTVVRGEQPSGSTAGLSCYVTRIDEGGTPVSIWAWGT